MGACQITLDNCNITAPDGVEALGNSQITVNGGSITSTGTAIKVVGNGKVSVNGATIKGKTQKVGANAIIEGVK
jgi:hypothetical protein